MSAIPSEQTTTPVAQAPDSTAPPAATTTPKAAPENKFDGARKAVGSRAKRLLSVIHSAGEHIRGNVNAALDGVGDAITGKKIEDVKNKPSQEPASARAAPEVTSPAEAPPPAPPAPAAAPTAEETLPATAPVEESPPSSVPEPQPAPAGESPEKRYALGKFFNKSLKRTFTLVHHVGDNLKSNTSRKIDSVGNTVSRGKERASKRFSKVPKSPEGEATAAA
ncbi:hypothetical protein O181_004592 [Austropuccinia psidii MF-1]|uniref:Uncharacterized protein n=1 Tax=Austropuccinia psidii MF-1 TaxID=1389203 RepID=A0A9Q3GFX9_9BASI|nr:hypothetical protein [Austropuccinia psidii MF-1]